MKRRKLISTIPLALFAGCMTVEKENITHDTTHDIEDDVVHVRGRISFACNSGFADNVEIALRIFVDGEEEHHTWLIIDLGRCGRGYEWSYSYKIEQDEWNSVNVEVEVLQVGVANDD